EIDTRTTKVAKTSDMITPDFVEIRQYFNEGTHTIRAAFLNDDFPKSLSDKDRFDIKKNKFLDSIEVVGPFESKIEKASRKRVLICDPASGQACVARIARELARHAYRRPVTQSEVTTLVRVYDRARTKGYTPDQSVQFVIDAVLVSPHFLFRIERNPRANDPN